MVDLVNTTLDDIAPVVGFSAAVRLSAHYGGRDLHVPAEFNSEHPISRLIGDARMKALVTEWGGGRLSIPTLAAIRAETRDAKVLSLLLRGVDCYAIANVTEIGYRRVKQLRQEFVASGVLQENVNSEIPGDF